MARQFVKANFQRLQIATALVTAAPLSIALWYNQAAAITADQVLASVSNSTSTNQCFDVPVYNSDKLVRAEVVAGSSDDDTAKSSTVIGSTSNTWFHILAVYASATSRTMYVNGANPGSSVVSVTPTGLDSSTLAGIGLSSGALPSDGIFAFSAFYKAALTAIDALSLAQGAHPRRVRPGFLVSILNLTGGINPEPDYVTSTLWPFLGGGVPNEVNNPRIFW